MPSQEQINRLGAAQRRIAELVQGQLAGFYAALPHGKPEQMRNALLEFVPLLVDQFGPISEQIALEWYAEIRANGYTPAPVPNQVPRAAIEAKVRYQAGHLFTTNPEATLVGISAALGKYVRQSGRDVIAYNSEREGIHYARIPRGAKTCSFCLMLAGRTDEWLYNSFDTAKYNQATGEPYHDGNCDCEVVPVESEDDFPDPHQRREYFEMYRSATEAVGSRNDTTAILSWMRREYPDQLSDGVIDTLHTHQPPR